MYNRQVDTTTVLDIIMQEKEQLESLSAYELVDHVSVLFSILNNITTLDSRSLESERKYMLLHSDAEEIIERILPYHVMLRTGCN